MFKEFFISPHSPAGNLTVWGPFQSFLKCSVLEPKPFVERRLGFKQTHRTRDQKPKQKDFPPSRGSLLHIFLKKRKSEIKVITKFKNKSRESVPKTSAHSKVQVTFKKGFLVQGLIEWPTEHSKPWPESPEEEHPASAS